MRLPAAIFLCLIFLAIVPDRVEAQEPDQGTSAVPSDGVIVSMAQQFVLEHFKRSPEAHFSIAFDIANIHPQPDPDYWAVVGGFMANSGVRNYRPHAFGIAMRLPRNFFHAPRGWNRLSLIPVASFDLGMVGASNLSNEAGPNIGQSSPFTLACQVVSTVMSGNASQEAAASLTLAAGGATPGTVTRGSRETQTSG